MLLGVAYFITDKTIRMQKVYLAGGMHSDWRERVRALKNVEFIDPKEKEMKRKFELQEYGTWDLNYIKSCDICFVCMEKSNPSGFGLAVEAGYAKGKDKTVILVLEQGHEKDRYLQFLRKVADATYDNLEEAIDFLGSFI